MRTPNAHAQVRCSTFKRFRGTAATAGMVIAASVVIAACGSSSSGGASAPGVSGKKVTVGLNLATSGPFAVLAQTASGVDAYFKQLDAKGGVNGYTFKTVTGDNANQSAQATSVARQQATSSFTAIGVADDIVSAMGPVAKVTKQPVMVGANGSLLMPAPKYVFGMLPVYSSEADYDASFIFNKLDTKDLAFVYSNDDVGQPAQSTIPGYVKSQGGKLLADVPVSPTQTDFSSTAARLKASGAKVVLSWADLVALPQIQKAAAAIGYDPKWVSSYIIVDPGYTSVAGSLAKGVYADDFQYPVSLNSPQVKQYNAAMQKYSPKNVQSTFAQQGWTFAAIIAAAVKKATSSGKPLTREAYIDALNSLPGGPIGLLPTVGISSTRHYASTQGAMFQWTGSAWNQVTSFSQFPNQPGG